MIKNKKEARVELSMIGDTFFRKTCQGGDCKVFEVRKVYNTTLTTHQRYNGIVAKALFAFALNRLTLWQDNQLILRLENGS